MTTNNSSTTSTGKDDTTSSDSTGDNNTTPSTNTDASNTATTDGGDKGGGAQTAMTDGSDQGSKDSSAQKPAEGASEIKIELPEGVEVDKSTLDNFVTVAKESGLTNEQANAVAKSYVEMQQAQVKVLVDQDKTWDEQLRKDADFGGENYDANAAMTRKVVLTLGGQELVDLINDHMLGNNPVLAKAFWNARELVKEDNSRSKGAPPAGSHSEEQILRQDYPSMFDGDGKPITS